MTTDAAFLRAIRERPDADDIRLVYADWLEERGDMRAAGEQRLHVAMKAIIANPDDDSPRLEFAGICETHEMPERGEFVRCQLELATISADVPVMPKAGSNATVWNNFYREQSVHKAEIVRQDTLRRREQDLLLAHRKAWVIAAGRKEWRYWQSATEQGWAIQHSSSTDGISVTFIRGCIGAAILPWSAWAGEACGGCGGHGAINPRPIRGNDGAEHWEDDQCPTCSGSGRTQGHAAALLAAAPIRDVWLTTWPDQGWIGKEAERSGKWLHVMFPLPAGMGRTQEELVEIAELLTAHAVSLGAAPGIRFHLPASDRTQPEIDWPAVRFEQLGIS